jgi:hypothetical protein
MSPNLSDTAERTPARPDTLGAIATIVLAAPLWAALQLASDSDFSE